MVEACTIDTNVLIYSANRSNPQKHVLADDLVQMLLQTNPVVPLQCFNEFYRACTSKRLLTEHEASEIVRKTLRLVRPVSATTVDLIEAIELHRQHHLQFFDALLLATAARAGCTILFSEDLQDNRTFGSITVRNPFIMRDSDLATLLA